MRRAQPRSMIGCASGGPDGWSFEHEIVRGPRRSACRAGSFAGLDFPFAAEQKLNPTRFLRNASDGG